MSGSELISVIMPVYNAERFIAESIKSVLNQSYPDFELLIINDGSTDQTEKIIKSFTDSRILYFSQKNCGVSAARNVGLNHMSGNYFCFLDADDVMPAGSLESRLKIFKSGENMSFVDGKVIFFEKEITNRIKTRIPKYRGNPLEDLLRLTGKSFFGNTWMIRRKPGKTYQFNTRLKHGEDLLFYIQQARDGGIYSYTENPVLYYRKGHSSAMSDIQGIEKSYHEIYHEIKKMDDISEKWEKAYLKKAKSIIWKSYLGHGQPYNALNSIFRKWDNQ